MDIEIALEIALKAHRNQKDKGGTPYILHPLAVMNRVETINEKIVAVLHDVVEDTEILLEDLRSYGFQEEIINAVDGLTRRVDEPYDEFIDRVKNNSISRIVKLADIQENMDLSRLRDITDEDYKRNEKYQIALEKLNNFPG